MSAMNLKRIGAVAVLLLLFLMIYGVRVACKTPQRLRRFVDVACWLYGIASAVLWLIVRETADRWWPATVFLFGPCWLWSLPLLPLAVAAAWVRRQALWVLLAAAWIVLFPVLGLQVPWRLAIPHSQSGQRIRVLTCNLHRQDAGALAAVVAATQPDVVAIQEWSGLQPLPAFGRGDWHCSVVGELLLASRFPILKVDNLAVQHWPEPGEAVRYELETPGGRVPFINLRLASPHPQLEDLRWHSPTAPAELQDNSLLRLQQSRIIGRYAEDLGRLTMLAGDFNTPQGSVILRQCWSRFANAFSTAGCGFGHTYHTPWVSTRIDQILAGSAWRCRRCWVGPDVGSPHRPLIADLEILARPGN